MLRATHLHYAVAGRALVREVSLTVAPGEFLAVLGPNGAGKTTLLKLLAGEAAPHGGTVELNGRPLAQWRHAQRAQIRAVLPQESRLAFAFTALEVALFGRYPHRAGALTRGDREIARAALAATDCAHLAARDFTTLSGGEKARVQLARVLAQLWEPCVIDGRRQPRCLLLDEPTAALDLAHQHATLAAARRFAHEQGDVAVLAVLHDLNLAAQYADRLLMLREGAVAATGTPAQVLTEPGIESVFGLPVRVLRHPDTGLPLVAARATPSLQPAAWAS
jgi:iron complex transport system ATP-binding protein